MNSYKATLCLLFNHLMMRRSSFTYMLGFLTTSKTVEGNSKLIVVGFPTHSVLIFTSAKKLKIPHSCLSLFIILYSNFVLERFLKEHFRSLLSLSFSHERRLIRPISQLNLLCPGFLFNWSLASHINEFIAFLSCNVVTLLICTILLCFLISQIEFLPSKSGICFCLAIWIYTEVKKNR